MSNFIQARLQQCCHLMSAAGLEKKLFALLAREEAKHKLRFEKIYDEEILK